MFLFEVKQRTPNAENAVIVTLEAKIVDYDLLHSK